jgi:hypothetical protein
MGLPEIATQTEKPLRERWADMVAETSRLTSDDRISAMGLTDYEMGLIERVMECEDVDQFFAMLPTIDESIRPGRFDKEHLDGLPYEYLLVLKVLDRKRIPDTRGKIIELRITRNNLPAHPDWQRSE